MLGTRQTPLSTNRKPNRRKPGNLVKPAFGNKECCMPKPQRQWLPETPNTPGFGKVKNAFGDGKIKGTFRIEESLDSQK